MISRADIVAAGTFGQPHGLKGELQAEFVRPTDPGLLDCIIVDIDGLPVPFFVDSARPRGRHSVLLTVDGIDSRERARMLAGHTIYLRREDKALLPEEEDADGFYADDLVGFTALDTGGNLLGTITDFDDTTENVLLIMTRADGRTAMIPAVDEFIAGIEPDNRRLTLELPDGLLDD